MPESSLYLSPLKPAALPSPRPISHWREVLSWIGGVLLFTWVAAYVHYGYKQAAFGLAVKTFHFANQTETIRYLRDTSASTSPLASESEQIEAYLVWLHHTMLLQDHFVSHPNPVVLLQRGGICGQFTVVFMDWLRAKGWEARRVMLNWNGQSTAHVIVEVRLNGKWVAYDPLAFGGAAFAGNTLVSHISLEGKGLSTLELYHHPELLPPQNGFGAKFFQQGSAFKVEMASDYREVNVRPSFLYGRDWPTVKATSENAAWVYEPQPTPKLRSVSVWHAFPYFSRVTFWWGNHPLVLHWEWPLLTLGLACSSLVRFRKQWPRKGVVGGSLTLAVLFLTYFGLVLWLWYGRYQI